VSALERALNNRVLIVEDEALIALDIAGELMLAGFRIVGPATSVNAALTLISDVGCDVAVLDVNVRDETSERIASVLRTAGTPFLFLSGLSRDQYQNWMAEAPFISKPVDYASLLSALQSCLDGTS